MKEIMTYSTEVKFRCAVSNEWLVEAMGELNHTFGLASVNVHGNLEWQASPTLTIMAKPKVTDDASLILYIVSINTIMDCIGQLLALGPTMTPESLFKTEIGESTEASNIPDVVTESVGVVRSLFNHPRFHTTIESPIPHGSFQEQGPKEPA